MYTGQSIGDVRPVPQADPTHTWIRYRVGGGEPCENNWPYRPSHSVSCLSLIPSSAPAYREYFTLEQKVQLEKIQTVLVDVLTITDKGGVDASALADSRRTAPE